LKAYHEQMVPYVRSQKGNVNAFVLADRKTGKTVAMSIWKTEADMRNDQAVTNRPKSVNEAAGGEPTEEIYELAAGHIE
jgi:heme-degrading monooxygenase HmoA